MKFHKVVKNAENQYQTLWSDEHEEHWFVCSSSRQFIGEPYEVDEAMGFRSSKHGVVSSWTELAVRKPHTIDHTVHGELVQEAYDNLSTWQIDDLSTYPARESREEQSGDFSDIDWVG